MPEATLPVRRLHGGELRALNCELRITLFRAALCTSVLMVPAAAAMILVVGDHVRLRLALLSAVAALCAGASCEAPRCLRVIARHRGATLLTATIGSTCLALGGGRQNASFMVIATALVAIPVATDLATGLLAGLVVIGGYALGIAVSGEAIVVGGFPGDVAAMTLLLLVIYAASLATDLATGIVTDVNREIGVASSWEAGGQRPSVPDPRRSHSEDGRDRSGGPGPAEGFHGVAHEEATGILRDSGEPDRLAAFGLTPREWDVALLAADGRGQKAIATELEISPRTVEKHLSAIKNKLGVSTSAELTAKLAKLLALPATSEHPASPRCPVGQTGDLPVDPPAARCARIKDR